MRSNVVFAIFKRNLVSYFSQPIGYVFICAFVLLSAFAAFWPNEFFVSNLANLNQLNQHLPWIMLVFIPAITMSIWADERRQGTDELLLTLPAEDREVVMGKYLAALAIFTVALLFSLSNVFVLSYLGNPDLGLLLGNYIGYWLVGAAMLAVGMAASFLTNNLTVAFILGAAMNAPLAFASSADAIFGRRAALAIKGLSLAEQFRDFGAGVLTLSGIMYFASIAGVMIYLSMVLIGRRHWQGRVAVVPMTLHYAARCLCLAAIALGLNALAHRYDTRLDVSSGRLSSLSPRTRALLRELNDARPVFIDAYISPQVPEQYVQTRLNVLNALREMDAIAGDAVAVRVHDTEPFSESAAEAESQFGIPPRQVVSSTRGSIAAEQIFLGVAFMSGLDKVVVPFIERGTPVEYELIRSIATVSQLKRKRIGVLTTDAKLFGDFDFQTMGRIPQQEIINELQRQYEVVQVNPASPITDRYDVLLAVQPSSLTEPQMLNLIEAVKRGQPTAIFEDPFPYLDPNVPGTAQPRRPPGNNPFMQRQMPEPKGDVTPLWDLLQVNFPGTEIVWDTYNPFPRFGNMEREFVFIGAASGAHEPFNQASRVSSGLQLLAMLFPARIEPRGGSTLTFTHLLGTTEQSGTVMADDMLIRDFFSTRLNPMRRHYRKPPGTTYTLGARITGALPAPPASPGDGTAVDAPGSIDLTLIGDIDVLYSQFFSLRPSSDPTEETTIALDNVTFVLNVLDDLAGDDRFIDIRKRRAAHRTLTHVEEKTESARAQADEQRRLFMDEFNTRKSEAESQLKKKIEEVRAREGVDPQQMILEVATAQQVEQNRLDAAVKRLERQRDQEIEKIERDLALRVREVQDTYKLAAVAVPPIPPLILAVGMFFRKRKLEHIGVSRARLKQA
jgi:ABC-2 type transport system permease protein